jgi:hypothetical protein
MLGLPSEARRLAVSLRGTTDAFDGNFTDCATNWIFSEDEFTELTDRGLAILTEMTWQGNLSWVVFVPPGYRL